LTAASRLAAAPKTAPGQAAPALDPVTVEVIRRRLVAIADEVDVNITRTAFSPYIYEYKDYAVGIVDHEGSLICQCTAAMPVFVADVMRAAVRDGLDIYGADDLNEGDIVINNYAGVIGQHLNNMAMYTPIHVRAEDGQPALIGFMVVVMHWIDVGGRDVGSISKFATDIFQEGIQFRTVKLRARGEPVREIYRMIEHNTRFPVEMMGDINSQIGGCLMGRDEVAVLAGRYGIATFRAALTTIWDQAEAASRAAIRAIPDGTYAAEAVLDGDGLNPGSLPCRITVIVAGDEMTVDLSELPREVNAPMNCGRYGGGETVSRLAFRYLILPEGDANEGTFRPLKLVLPDGTIVSAGPTAAMGSYNSALPTLIDLVIRALGPALPDRVAGGHYGTFATLAFAGRRPENGTLWQCHDSGFGGWGALAGQDGPGPFRTMCHGDTRMIPVEVHEASYPFMIEGFALRADSGGAGEFRGGLGLTRRYLMLAPARMSTRFERTMCPAWGMHGGHDGAPGNVTIEAADGTMRNALKDSVQLNAGDRVRIETGGGGGFGDPRQRNRGRLREDVRKGYVSIEAARAIYGLSDDN
jgi:N-methylhydantoinase B